MGESSSFASSRSTSSSENSCFHFIPGMCCPHFLYQSPLSTHLLFTLSYAFVLILGGVAIGLFSRKILSEGSSMESCQLLTCS